MPAITGASRKTPGIFYDKGGAVWNAMHPDFEIVGDGVADDGAKVLDALADFIAAYPKGGTFVLRGKRIKHTVPIVLQATNAFLDGSHISYDFTGTVFLPDFATANQAAIDIAVPTSQEGSIDVWGGFVNGANSSATGTVGWRIRSQNTRLHGTCAVECNGANYDFQYTLAAPPIRCLFDGVRGLAGKIGVRVKADAFLYPAYSAGTAYVLGNVVSSGGINYRAKGPTTGNAPPNATYWDVYQLTCSGLRFTNVCWFEAHDEEGYHMDNVGQWADYGSIIENNGRVDPTKSEIYITNENRFSLRDTYLETDATSARPMVKIEGGTVPIHRGLITGCQFTGYPNVGAVAVEFGVVGAVYNVTVKENSFDGVKVGVNIGAFSKGHDVADNGWSDSYNPSGGSTTPVVDGSGVNTGRVKLSDNFRNTDTFKGTQTATNLVATAAVSAPVGWFGASDIGGSETLRINGAIRVANALIFATSAVAPAANVPGIYRTTGTGSRLNIRGGTDAKQTRFLTNSDAEVGWIDSSGHLNWVGQIIGPVGSTSFASLRAPHGAAPTAPVNGDIWTTTAGLFVRINGVTVGPLT